jgi:dTDP-4-dehydrorhamnose reductase
MTNITDAKIMVTGSAGMLGSELTAQLLQANTDTALFSWPDQITGSDKLDITDKNAVKNAFANIKPQILFNCSAYTDVDAAEEQTQLANKVNGTAVGILAEQCRQNNALLVHISTDYVFDGNAKSPYLPDHPTNPQTAYGKSKLLGENKITESGCKHIIIRTSWLYGANGKNFVKTIANLGRQKGQLKVVNDQFGCPTYTADLAKCMISLATQAPQGIYHFCNPPICTWYDFAVKALNLASINCDIQPCDSSQFPRPAKRPAYSALDVTQTQKHLNWEIPHWQDSLQKYIITEGPNL